MKKLSLKKKIIIYGILFFTLMILSNFIIKNHSKNKTEIAQIGEVQNTLKVNGFVVRNEEIIRTDHNLNHGVKYFFNDGEKVSKNGVLAQFYKNDSNAKYRYTIDSLNREIEILEKLNSSKYNYSQSINAVNSKINDEIKNLNIYLNDSNVKSSAESRNKILYLLNEKQIILGKNVDFDSKIKALKSEKERLELPNSNTVSEIKSPESGDFISHIDNFENKFDYKNLKFEDFTDFNPDNITPDKSQGNEIGKIIKSSTWYIVSKISESEADKISEGNEVKINIDGLNFIKNIPGKIETIKKDFSAKTYTLIISCEYMNKDIASIRNEEFKITSECHSGLVINRSSVHENPESINNNSEKNFGVYVIMGNYLKFKKINPTFWSDKEVVCKYSPIEEDDKNYLQLGDIIVTEGTDLYNGKKLT